MVGGTMSSLRKVWAISFLRSKMSSSVSDARQKNFILAHNLCLQNGLALLIYCVLISTKHFDFKDSNNNFRFSDNSKTKLT